MDKRQVKEWKVGDMEYACFQGTNKSYSTTAVRSKMFGGDVAVSKEELAILNACMEKIGWSANTVTPKVERATHCLLPGALSVYLLKF